MNKLCVFFVLAIISGALSMDLRHKRQSDDDQLEDRYLLDIEPSRQQPRQFPNFPDNNRVMPPWMRQQRPQQPRPTTQPPNGSTTQSTDTTTCMRSCPVTSEYNPVCGTNSVTYNNPGRLYCAQSCGVNVNLLRSSPCPASTTAAPN